MNPDRPAADSLTLAGDAAAPAAARRFVSDLVTDLHPDSAYDALVAVSELVTNSVRHGLAPITVHVARRTDTVTISVHDVGPSLPPAHIDATPNSTPGGRGLVILAAVGTGWGIDVDAEPPGKSVWVSFATA